MDTAVKVKKRPLKLRKHEENKHSWSDCCLQLLQNEIFCYSTQTRTTSSFTDENTRSSKSRKETYITQERKTCRKLTQSQGRSRIPEGTSQCLGGCGENTGKIEFTGDRGIIHSSRFTLLSVFMHRGSFSSNRQNEINKPEKSPNLRIKLQSCKDNPKERSVIQSTWGVEARNLQHGPEC